MNKSPAATALTLLSVLFGGVVAVMAILDKDLGTWVAIVGVVIGLAWAAAAVTGQLGPRHRQ